MNNKRRVLISLSVFAAVSAFAQDALDLCSRAQLRRHRLEQSSPAFARGRRLVAGGGAGEASRAVTLAFATLAEGASASDLEKAGMKVLSLRGNIAIVEVAYDDVERFSALPALRSLQLQRSLNPKLDLARKASGIDAIHAGDAGLPQAYTGRGVLTAIVDQGVDPNHINFRDDGGKTRVSYLSHLRINAAGTGMAETFYGDGVYEGLPVSSFSTDDASNYHGTHTLGIMSGGYRGNVEVAEGMMPDGNTPNVKTLANPYYGVATESDIAVSCGTLADAFVAYGMDYIYGYSEYVNKPLVYNLSLGSNVGSHDPASTMARFLDLVGEKAIICISAGNEGDLKIALNKTFSASDNTIRTLIYPYAFQYDATKPESTENNTIRYGQVSVYSEDDSPFELQAVIYNRARGYRVAKRLPKVGDNVGTYYCSSSEYQMDDTDVVGDATFKRAFDGYVGVGGKIDEDTGRYYGMIDYYVTDSEENRESGNYVLGFEIVGKNGQRVDCYCDGVTTWLDSYGVEGFDDGSANGSISDMAVGHNVIVVGSYNTRQVFNTLDGYTPSYADEGYAPGLISPFSSYGTLADGRNLPTVCAPGSAIISSMSSPYLKAATSQYTEDVAEDYRNYLCSARAKADDGNVYYWKQELGTSMSTPLVAGSIALWLEADPTLDVSEVREIIEKTAIVDDDVRAAGVDPVKWGAGKFDAIGGLKEVIRRSAAGLGDVLASSEGGNKLIVNNLGNSRFRIFCANASSVDAVLCNMAGTTVLSASAVGDETEIDASALPSGVYVLSVNGGTATKICLR